MKRKVKVAAVQMYIEPNNINANLSRMEWYIEQVSQQQCHLVVFPEDCITGPIPYRLDLVQSEKSKAIKFLKTLALTHKIYIVCGSFIKSKNSNYYNTSLLINDHGCVVLEYEKINLWIPERSYLTPGTKAKVVKTPLGKIGILICWDLAFPETARSLAKQGADIICCPSYWTVDDGGSLVKKYGKQTESTFVNTVCPSRAIENEVLFIYANGAGEAKVPLKTKTWTSKQIGQTQICAPVLGTEVKISDNSEGYIMYEYDFQITKNAERNYRIRKDILIGNNSIKT